MALRDRQATTRALLPPERGRERALQRLGLQAPRFDDEEEARPRDLAEPDDLRAVVRLELERLSAAQREALQLRVDELPYTDVADSLGISHAPSSGFPFDAGPYRWPSHLSCCL